MESVWYDVGITMLGLMLILFIYTLPSFIAYVKEHPNTFKITVTNVLFGFLVIPWIVLLAYAAYPVKKEQPNE